MKFSYLVILFFILLMAENCSTVPVTGRRQLSLVSDQEILTMSLQQYNDFMKTAPLSSDKSASNLVNQVGQNIAYAVKLYYQVCEMEHLLTGYSWEFTLINDNQVNAFCMPGGKIVVYEGILPYTQTEAGLAVVIGHEVGHAIAKHANERVSQQMLSQYGATTLNKLLSNSSSAVQSIGQIAFGLGAELGVMLPYSRRQELEADQLGLIFMAIAGYHPKEAEVFWQRMATKGASAPEFMSTHPSDQTRIAEIQKAMPEAMVYYNAVKGLPTTPSTTNQGTNTSNEWRF